MSLSNNLGRYTVFNANCLSVLERLEDKSFDLVYLDPPWNIGNNFVFNSEESLDYEEFITKVLQQTKRVLKDTGNVILHSVPFLNVDFHNLFTLVFGKDNFRAEFILPIKKLKIPNKLFQHNHETIINYVVSDKSKFFPLIEHSKEEVEKHFPLKEGKKRFKLQTLTIHGDSPKFNYDWNGFILPDNLSWRFSQNKMTILEKENKIFYEKGMKYPKLKVFSDDFSLQTVNTVWNDIATYEKKSDFAGEQSEKLLNRIIQLFSEEGDMILDPFAGTGTSGSSAIKNKRKWVGVEIDKIIFKEILKRIKDVKLKQINEDDLSEIQVVYNSYYDINDTEEDIYLTKINGGENERLEFKEMYIYNHYTKQKENTMPSKIIREIVGFLNSKYGGEVLIGVKDDGEILGIKKDIEYAGGNKKNIDGLELTITNKIKDKIGGFVIDLVEISFPTLKNKQIISIEIKPTKNPVFLGNEFIVRNGTTSSSLKAREFFDLMKERKIK